VGEVASSNLVVPTIYFQSLRFSEFPEWVQPERPAYPLAVRARNGRFADDPEVNDQYAFFVLELYPPLRQADTSHRAMNV
jgi:hypothetical protein